MLLRLFRESWLAPFLLISFLPLFWSILALNSGFALSGDNAWITLRTFDVFSTNPSLTGMPSTSFIDAPGINAFHPGPIQFILLAPLYLLSGWSPMAVAYGSLALHLSLVAISLWTAWRLDHPAAKFVAIGGNLIVVLNLQTGLFHPWNPRPVELGMIPMVLLAWAILVGRTGCWPWFILVSALVAQSHIVGLPIVWLLIGVMVLFGWKFGFPRMPGRRESVIAIIVFAIAWALPIWDVVHNWPGNLGEVLAYMFSGSDGSGQPAAEPADEWRRKLYIYAAIGCISTVRGLRAILSADSPRKTKEWGAGSAVLGVMNLGLFGITFIGGPDRLLYNSMFSGLMWAGLLLLIPKPPQLWERRSLLLVLAALIALFSISSYKNEFLDSLAEFREHGLVVKTTLEITKEYSGSPIVVSHDGSYSWMNLYSATILGLVERGEDVHYDPFGHPEAYDVQRRNERIQGPYLEILISDREGGIPTPDRYDADTVIASRTLDLDSAEHPVTLTLFRVAGD